MSQWVYLSSPTCLTTRWEDTPMRIRIQLSSATVKALQSRLQHAYRRDDVRLGRRITVLLGHLVHQVAVAVLCARWELSPSCLYAWQRACMWHGMDSLRYRHSAGRPEKLTPSQKKRVGELIEAGPWWWAVRRPVGTRSCSAC